RLHGPASLHPSATELVEALVVSAYIHASQHHDAEAATFLGCAEALRARTRASSDPFLMAMADHVREQLAGNMDPEALHKAMECGRTTAALTCFTAELSGTNRIAYNAKTVE
ncbi:MAG: hypothetical protein M3380_20470, partial [Chloroflexota bacterium]|nr:hypothetical protein [Chloroflexota bacterium]